MWSEDTQLTAKPCYDSHHHEFQIYFLQELTAG